MAGLSLKERIAERIRKDAEYKEKIRKKRERTKKQPSESKPAEKDTKPLLRRIAAKHGRQRAIDRTVDEAVRGKR